jgi:hypothetical protein
MFIIFGENIVVSILGWESKYGSREKSTIFIGFG